MKQPSRLTFPLNILINIAAVYLCYGICRITFLAEHWVLFQENISYSSLWQIFQGGLVFDTSAIFYTNSIYLLLSVFPLHHKEKTVYQYITKSIYITCNAICIVANLADTVFFAFNRHRTTTMVFSEFENETNLGQIAGIECVRHWYLVVLAILLIAFLYKCYRHPHDSPVLLHYYTFHSATLLLLVPTAICGMRGGILSTSSRPIAIGNAYQYVTQPLETGIVLNTPFSILRTLNETPQRTPSYFEQARLDSVYSPLHRPDNNAVSRKKNIVILIVESFAQEFVGALNTHLDNGSYKGYTPFTDSLLQHSLTFEETFSNSGFSIDAMPAILASIPRMDRPFVLTPFALNHTNSLATELKKWGYYTAFFHGADNHSMGFQAFARAIGFDDYFGRTEFEKDSRFNGKEEYDGTWAIWDEPFLQFYCQKMNEMKEPFFTSLFTATSHHPFAVPTLYKDTFKDEGAYPLHKCIRYSDYSLKRFFATASHQPWYDNTLFVITADHASSRTTHAEYKTEVGQFRIPILFFDPSGEMPQGRRKGIAQQIDIMPTLLRYIGYDQPYIAFGKDLWNTKPEDTWAMNWDHIPQFIQRNYVLQFDGRQATSFFNYQQDPLLRHNLLGDSLMACQEMEMRLKAFIQSYMTRMQNDSITLKKP